jgi:hypothetical protein
MALRFITYHVFDVDESILSTPLFKQGQGITDELPQTVVLLLPIVDAITQIFVPAIRQLHISID